MAKSRDIAFKAILKMPTGIEGFDKITGGGLPRGRTSLLGGGPGDGKTIFSLQTLIHGATQCAEPGIFVAFEENSRQIIANAATFGWDCVALERKNMFFLDARIGPETARSGNFDLSAMLAGLKAKAEQMGARRIVFDSIDVLLLLLDDPAAERREIYRLLEWLSETQLTCILTAKHAPTDVSITNRYSFLQFIVDCVVVLDHRFEGHVSQRSLGVKKYRGSAFAENVVAMRIGSTGVDVADSSATSVVPYEVSSERVSSGVKRLDTLLGGGYFRGSSILVSGGAGTAKTTLSGAFIDSACSRGEKTIYVTFDQGTGEVCRNLASVGIDLARHEKSGILKAISLRAETKSAEEHLMTISSLVKTLGARCLVVDPLSAMIKVGSRSAALGVAHRLLRPAQPTGMTVLCTCLLDSKSGPIEGTAMDISTVVDTWIHMSYSVQDGERNRAVTIVKSRGSNHSNQVRELVLSDEGITLTDVYAVEGDVLMGTARWQSEAAERLRGEYEEAVLEKRRLDLALAEAETLAKIEVLKRGLEAGRAEVELAKQEQRLRQARKASWNLKLLEKRGSDHDGVEAPRPTRKRGPMVPLRRRVAK